MTDISGTIASITVDTSLKGDPTPELRKSESSHQEISDVIEDQEAFKPELNKNGNLCMKSFDKYREGLIVQKRLHERHVSLFRLWVHVDSGANVFAFRDKFWLLYFKPKRLP